MEKYNNTSIFTGYLKQLLHNFNLPKLKVYTKDQAKYFEENGIERFDVLETVTRELNGDYPEHLRYIPYLKDGLIQEYVNGKWETVGTRATIKHKAAKSYSYGEKLLNYTKNLIIKNNVYDTYTHEYLGDYLRFQRDYAGLNLMPLYNCFSNTTCNNLFIKSKFLIQEEHYEKIILNDNMTIDDYLDKYLLEGENTYLKITEENKNNLGILPGLTEAYEFVATRTGEFVFDTHDTNYKIFMLPVKLFQTYTIAIDSSLPIEICCGVYGKYQDTREKFIEVPGLTYKKFSHSQFLKPILYTEILNLNQLALSDSIVELAQNEADLKLFLKIPVSNTSTIVILEGNYLAWNDFIYKPSKQTIIDIERSGQSAPDSSIVIPAGKYYLDTLHKNIYQYDGNSWKNLGFIWSQASTNINKFNKKYKSFSLIIDDNQYSWGGINGEVRYLPEEDYFKYYLQNNLVDTAEHLAYFNTKIKKLFINNDWTKYTNHDVLDIEPISTNTTIADYEYTQNLKSLAIKKEDFLYSEILLKTPLQLLRANTTMQYPYADRLIEYLIENCITNREDEISDNIKRTQKLLHLNYNYNNYNTKFPGIWDNRINKIIYNYINTHNNTFEVNHDILGFIDKDTEKYYSHTFAQNVIDPVTNKEIKKYTSTSISTVELEEEEK